VDIAKVVVVLAGERFGVGVVEVAAAGVVLAVVDLEGIGVEVVKVEVAVAGV